MQKSGFGMALQYLDNQKMTPNNTANLVQKTPFSIEDILYQNPNSNDQLSMDEVHLQEQEKVQRVKDNQMIIKANGFNSSSDQEVNNVRRNPVISDRFKVHSHPQPSVQMHAQSYNPGMPPINNLMYSNSPYGDGYLQMALGAYLTPTTGYKSVDPYFLSQGTLDYAVRDLHCEFIMTK